MVAVSNSDGRTSIAVNIMYMLCTVDFFFKPEVNRLQSLRAILSLSHTRGHTHTHTPASKRVFFSPHSVHWSFA